ncbi:diguanylate cyclase/phosphodiesterase [Arcobacter nitrofigilis DSM 7299]|uniref:Diguanylate cyclase/phosphodiesterase n=1 Tax=Arcobacter nitrofigilis (strain ATCC 33309 / DSM 7299 / CCUG 15893 / LMG 7604 / NCTC 12251 / CI) TaxID=572480 RepID=D5V3X4_ARCNC|nr:EAL domain-containing protein [Arcobacter nitrofigilis]ADG92802.1 diguanylate cyclase/phosphodiesterase [Arcobacter nitrofigilis DSM 7299]
MIPSFAILFTCIIITFILIKNDYKDLDTETKQIRISYIKEEKKELKNKIDELLRYIKYSKKESNTSLFQENTLNFIKNVINTKDNYIFVLNEDGKAIYHPKLISTDKSIILSKKEKASIANELISEAIKNPKGSYLTYFWIKNKKGEKEEKTTFVYYLKDWKWIIATGTYMKDIELEISKRINKEEELIKNKIQRTIIIALIIVLLIFFISYFIASIVNKRFNAYREEVEEKEEKLKNLNNYFLKLASQEREKRTKKEYELQIIYIDRLTELPNRLKLSKDLEKQSAVKLMILNINRFTDINNFYSYKVADKLLKEIANFLKNLFINNSDIRVYKLAVDEFAILSTSKNLSSLEFVDICKTTINKIEFNPFTIGEDEIIVSITGGISLHQNHSFINADTALKIAKERNKDYFIYNENENIDINFKNNIKMTKILKDAINENRVVLFKQAIISNENNEINKYECLVRIKQKDGSIISPYLFLDVSKKIKLYPKLTRAVIQNAFIHFKNKKCDFSINLSLDDILDEATVAFIKLKLASSKIAHHVIFEIVETEGIDNFEEVSLFIKEMKNCGCRIAIDDFGTGYSNFDYMMKLNVDFIKIDGAFIKNIDTDEQSQILTELIISFAKKQNIKTIAEYVHSKTVYEKVKSLNIDYSQGYYLGEPIECI